MLDNLGDIVGEIASATALACALEDNVPRVLTSRPVLPIDFETACDQILISGKANFAIFERLLWQLCSSRCARTENAARRFAAKSS